MEKKGIISDRCELNRQIKADNALLRELKAAVKKLAQEVLHSLPELAKSMEFLRQKLLFSAISLTTSAQANLSLENPWMPGIST